MDVTNLQYKSKNDADFGTFSLHCKSEGLFRELEKAPENWKAPSENRKAFSGNQKASSKEVEGFL